MDKKLRVIFGGEVILACILLVNILRPTFSHCLLPEEMQQYSSARIEQINGKNYLLEDSKESNNLITYPIGRLGAGAYEIVVNYFAEIQDEEQNSSNDTSEQQHGGKICVFTEEIPNAVQFRKVLLNTDMNEKSSIFWVQPGYKKTQIESRIEYSGNGILGIESISIVEKRSYRVVFLLEYLVFIFLLNFSYVVWKGILFRGQRKFLLICSVTLVLSSLPVSFEHIALGDDARYHLNRIVALAEAIQEVQIPNRIHQNGLGRYGYISPIFYGELFLYLPAILVSMGVKVHSAFGVYNILVNLATIVISYHCLYKMLDNQNAAILGMMAYTLAPYRMVDMYSRFAVGEYSAWTFLPLILYGFWIIYTHKEDQKIKLRECIPLIVGATGLIQTHILSCEMTLLFILLFMLICIRKTFRKTRIIALVKSLVWILLLNLWFIYPFLDSSQMKLNVFEKEIELIGNRGLQVMDLFTTSINPSSRFYPGEMAIISIVCTVLILLKCKDEMVISEKKREIQTLFCFTVISMLLTLTVFPYDKICSYSQKLAELICMIQFPWRFLAFASLFSSFLLAEVYLFCEKRNLVKESSFYILQVIMIVCFLSSIYTYRGYDKVFTANEISSNSIGAGEYLLADTDLSLLDGKVVTSENVEATPLLLENGKKKTFIVNNSLEEGRVVLPILDYDNILLRDDDNQIIAHETGDNNQIMVRIPSKFNGSISAEYREPLSWRIAEVISLFFGGILCAYIIFLRKKN